MRQNLNLCWNKEIRNLIFNLIFLRQNSYVGVYPEKLSKGERENISSLNDVKQDFLNGPSLLFVH